MELKEGYKQTEVGMIPSDWGIYELGKISKLKNGINKEKENFGFGYPFVNLLDVFGISTIDSSKELNFINSNDEERKLYSLRKGDILFVRSSVKPSGVGLTTLIKENLPNTVFSGFLIRYRDEGQISNDYKEYCFHENGFRNRLIANSTVSANTNINQEALKKLIVILPPTKAEQTAIATVLSDADALIQSLEKLIAKKRLIKQGAMQELLKPKEGWEVKKLGEIAFFTNGKAHEQFIDDAGDYIVVNSKFISTEGEVFKNASIRLCPLNIGDITMVMSDIPNGKALAKCFIIPKSGKYTLNQRICALRSETLDTIFLAFVINRNKYFLAFDSGTGQTNLKKQDVLECPINLPPTKKEQTHIATILSDMDSEISALETKFTKYKQVKQGMMQNLLTGKIRLV